MENWWIENNGSLSPLTNLSSISNNTNSINSNNVSRNWIPNMHNSVNKPTLYESNVFPNLQSATVDTFIQSVTQRLQLAESPSTSLYQNTYFDYNPIQTMANYRAVTQYCNSRRIDINSIYFPFSSSSATVTANRQIYPSTTFLSVNNMQQFSNFLQQNAVTQQQIMQQSSQLNENIEKIMQKNQINDTNINGTLIFENSLHKNANFYPKNINENFQKSSSFLSNNLEYQNKYQNYNTISGSNSNVEMNEVLQISSSRWSNSEIWCNSKTTETYNKCVKSSNSTLDINDSDISCLKSEDSEKLNDNVLDENFLGKTENYVFNHIEKFYDYINPYSCEFCQISHNCNSKVVELHQQKLLKSFQLNPLEFSKGIRVILDSIKDEKITEQMINEKQKYKMDEKRKMEEKLLQEWKKCQQTYVKMRSHEMIWTFDQNKILTEQKTYDEFLKNYKNECKKIKRTLSSNMLYDEETQRLIRLIELVCIGPLEVYDELLQEHTHRPRMPYTYNFMNTHCGDKVYNFGGEHMSQEKFQEIMFKHIQLKARNRTY